ncbi:MAG: hypothetical protein ACI4B3_07595 [Prevotella sp.]
MTEVGVLTVPVEAVDTYKKTDGWKDFNVLPMAYTITITPPSSGTIKIYYTDTEEEIPLVDGVFKVT